MNFVVALTITLGSVLAGYAATGGVLDQPFEFLIICGASIGIFIVANPLPTIKDAGKAIFEAITDQTPKRRDYLDLLNALHALMREPDETPSDTALTGRVPKGRKRPPEVSSGRRVV
ncbi:MAG: hypothetical protein P4L80_18805 [Xanthobacteraceae bacterium]|nr:hypothetical protein [Xanthobacteraceae bacterium]